MVFLRPLLFPSTRRTALLGALGAPCCCRRCPRSRRRRWPRPLLAAGLGRARRRGAAVARPGGGTPDGAHRRRRAAAGHRRPDRMDRPGRHSPGGAGGQCTHRGAHRGRRRTVHRLRHRPQALQRAAPEGGAGHGRPVGRRPGALRARARSPGARDGDLQRGAARRPEDGGAGARPALELPSACAACSTASRAIRTAAWTSPQAPARRCAPRCPAA